MWLPFRPIAASRPRVARNGGRFYPPSYTTYLKALREYLDKTLKEHGVADVPIMGPLLDKKGKRVRYLQLRLEFDAHKNLRGDFDNYAKAVCDAIQGYLIEDDFYIWSSSVEIREQQETEGVFVHINDIGPA